MMKRGADYVRGRRAEPIHARRDCDREENRHALDSGSAPGDGLMFDRWLGRIGDIQPWLSAESMLFRGASQSED